MHSPISCRVTDDFYVLLAAWTISRPPSAPLLFCWLHFAGSFYSIKDATTYVENESLQNKRSWFWRWHSTFTHPPRFIASLGIDKATKHKLNCFSVSVPAHPLTLNIIPNVSDTNKWIHIRWMSESGLQTLHHPVQQSPRWLRPISSISLFPHCSSFSFICDLLRMQEVLF